MPTLIPREPPQLTAAVRAIARVPVVRRRLVLLLTGIAPASRACRPGWRAGLRVVPPAGRDLRGGEPPPFGVPGCPGLMGDLADIEDRDHDLVGDASLTTQHIACHRPGEHRRVVEVD